MLTQCERKIFKNGIHWQGLLPRESGVTPVAGNPVDLNEGVGCHLQGNTHPASTSRVCVNNVCSAARAARTNLRV